MSQTDGNAQRPQTTRPMASVLVAVGAVALLALAVLLDWIPKPPGPARDTVSPQQQAEPPSTLPPPEVRPPAPPPPPPPPPTIPTPPTPRALPQGTWIGYTCTPWPAESCRLRCRIDAEAGTTDCPTSQVSLRRGQTGRLGARLDLRDLQSLELRARVCDPRGMVLHLADSPTCNGFGGDSGSRSHDAELHLVGSVLAVHAADAMRGQELLKVPDALPAQGCHELALWVADGEVRVASPCRALRTEHSLRLNPPDDREGPVDAEWYLGLNQVYPGGRSGSGLQSVELCGR